MIGLDISDRSLKIVEVDQAVDSRLRTAGWSPMAPNIIRSGVILDPAEVARVIAETMKTTTPHPVAGNEVTVSIPERQSFVQVVNLPVMSGAEMTEAVQWAVKQHIPFDLEGVYIDWQPLIAPHPQTGRQPVLVGAAQRSVVDPLLAVVDQLGLTVVALELEAQAIVRSLLPSNAVDVSGVLVVDLGATTTNVILFDRGAMRFTTSLRRGGDYLTETLAQRLHLEPSLAAEQKAVVGVRERSTDDEVAETLRAAAQQLVEQIQGIVQNIVAEATGAPQLQAILLAGGAANLPGLVDVFGAVFPGVPVQIGNPLINLVDEDQSTTPIMSPADASHFATAIGLALRERSYA